MSDQPPLQNKPSVRKRKSKYARDICLCAEKDRGTYDGHYGPVPFCKHCGRTGKACDQH